MESRPFPTPLSPAPPRQRTQLEDLIEAIPIVTLAILAVCVLNQCLVWFHGTDTAWEMQFTLQPLGIIYRLELWRLVTSSFFHGNLMHIAMNMLSFASLGASLERLFGSTLYFLLIVVCTLLGNVMYVLVCWAMAFWISGDFSWLMYQSVGFSGVIFSLAVMEAFLSPSRTRDLGCVKVPTKAYPIALAAAIQVFVPNASWLGHASGIAIGLAHVHGFLRCAVPSREEIQRIEVFPGVSRIAAHPNFVKVNYTDDIDYHASAVVNLRYLCCCLLRLPLEVFKMAWPTRQAAVESTARADTVV